MDVIGANLLLWMRWVQTCFYGCEWCKLAFMDVNGANLLLWM